MEKREERLFLAFPSFACQVKEEEDKQKHQPQKLIAQTQIFKIGYHLAWRESHEKEKLQRRYRERIRLQRTQSIGERGSVKRYEK